MLWCEALGGVVMVLCGFWEYWGAKRLRKRYIGECGCCAVI
jgi:hypothetical protein